MIFDQLVIAVFNVVVVKNGQSFATHYVGIYFLHSAIGCHASSRLAYHLVGYCGTVQELWLVVE